MYPRSFHYHRAGSLKEAVSMLGQLGEGAKFLAGGQSLIPLLKLRFANPEHLVDLNFIPDTSFIKEESGAIHFGAMTRHAEIELPRAVRHAHYSLERLHQGRLYNRAGSQRTCYRS